MIATYIQELLAVNNRVIIPNYGAFLVRATSKSKDAETLKEKLKDVYFSPFLKFNDELLEKYIITKEGITKEQASEKISLFIDDIKKVLDAEKPYEIAGFGKFTSDKQGKVQFITFAKEGAEVSPEDKKPETKTSFKTQEPQKEPATSSDKEPKKEIKQEEPKAEIKEEPKLEEVKPDKKEPESSTGENTKMNQPQTPASQPKPTYSYKKEKKPVNKGLILAVAIGLPLAAVFIWALLNISTIKKIATKNKSKTEQIVKKKPAVVSDKDSTNKQAKVKEGKKTTETKTVEQKPAPAVKKYYIIAGSFKNEEFATSYLNKLKEAGYNAEKLDKRNGMYAVSFNSFADKRKAIAEYKFLSLEKGLQAWILYY